MRVQEIGPGNKMGRLIPLRFLEGACLLTVVSTLIFSPSSYAASNPKFRLDLNMGYSMQGFAGVSGANFTSINRLMYSAAFFYRFRPKWDNGIQYTVIPSISISPFVFSDNIVGVYGAKFMQFEYLTGLVAKKFRAHLILGYERFSLSGSPTLTATKPMKLYYGTQMSYDIFARHKLRIPFTLRLLKKGRRLYEFATKPNDPIDVKAGLEYAFATGMDFEF